MSTGVFIAIWLLCGAVAFWVLVDWWRKNFDVGKKDVVFFALFSALTGPLCLFAATGLWITSSIPKTKDANKIIWRRKQ